MDILQMQIYTIHYSCEEEGPGIHVEMVMVDSVHDVEQLFREIFPTGSLHTITLGRPKNN